MTVSVAVGAYNCPAAIGLDSLTSLAFQPKILITKQSLITAAGSAADCTFGMGWAVDTGTGIEQAGISGSSEDAAAISNVWRASSNVSSIYQINHTGSLILQASLESMLSNGFSFNWSTVSTGADIQYWAIGGDEISNVAASTIQMGAGTGVHAYTCGFQPDLIGVIATNLTSDEINSGGSVQFSLGWGTDSANQMVTSWLESNAAPTAATRVTQLTDNILHIHGASTQGLAALTSITSTGFELTYSTNSGAGAIRMHFLCIKGGRWKISQFNQATATGNQAITGVGFTPVANWFQSANQATSAAINTNARISLGTASSSSARHSLFGGDQHGTGTMISSSDISTTKCLKLMVEAGASPTIAADMDFVSNDADGLTVNNTTADATSRQIGVVSLGASVGQPAGARGKYIPGQSRFIPGGARFIS